ncbi:hypothetical protein LINPERPRIM_LOCUS33610, partial [Linum perenne]
MMRRDDAARRRRRGGGATCKERYQYEKEAAAKGEGSARTTQRCG